MTSGVAMAARATASDLIEDVGHRDAPRPATPARAPGGADAARHPHALPLPAGDGRRAPDRRDQATAPGRPAPATADPERYLAAALQAAAAARARSARIRAATVAALAPRDAGPAGRATSPGPAAPPATAARHGWSVSEKAAAAATRPWAPAPVAGRRFGGLSVAAAARAATIAFQPVRRPVPPAASADLPAPADPPGPAAANPAPEPARGAGVEAQRFARTVAELERYLAASRAPEPGSNVVPRPTLPLVDPEPSGRAWLRLWSRR